MIAWWNDAAPVCGPRCAIGWLSRRDREGHGTERPQASPQPRDEPLPSPDNTNPEAEHG